MKLIGNLNKQVESTNTKEEAKDVIANASMELTEDELDYVVGGGKTSKSPTSGSKKPIK